MKLQLNIKNHIRIFINKQKNKEMLSNNTQSKNKIHPSFDQNQEQTQMNISKASNKSHSPQPTDRPVNVKVKRKKVEQNLFLYWACLICILFVSYINVPMFLSEDSNLVVALIFIQVSICFIIFITNSCFLAQTKSDLCYLYFLFDTIFVAVCTAVVGFVGILTITMQTDNPIAYVLSILLNTCLFLFGGNSRVILSYCKYRKWQVVLFKMSLLLGLLAYLVLAAYFMKNSFQNVNLPPGNQESLKEFFFLYIFGLFTLYMQIFTKASDLDGSNDFQYYYQINQEDDIEVSLDETGAIENNETEAQKKIEPRAIKGEVLALE